MTISVVQVATPANGSFTVSATFAEAPTEGNKIITFCGTNHGASTDSPTPPLGFEIAVDNNLGGGLKAVFAHKEAGASEPTTVGWATTGGANQVFAIEVAGLVDSDTAGDLIDASDVVNDSGTSGTLGPLTAMTLDDVFLLAAFSVANTVSDVAFDNGFGSILQEDGRSFWAWKILTDGATTTPQTTATWTTSRFYYSALVAYRGAPAAPAHYLERFDGTDWVPMILERFDGDNWVEQVLERRVGGEWE